MDSMNVKVHLLIENYYEIFYAHIVRDEAHGYMCTDLIYLTKDVAEFAYDDIDSVYNIYKHNVDLRNNMIATINEYCNVWSITESETIYLEYNEAIDNVIVQATKRAAINAMLITIMEQLENNDHDAITTFLECVPDETLHMYASHKHLVDFNYYESVNESI